jgi:hypothetical protein
MTHSIIADLRKHGFVLVSVAEPDLMVNDPTRILVRQMMGAVAQYEKSQIALKLRGARMRKRAKEGRCEGRKPYGYYDGESAALERLKALRTEGLGFDRIAARVMNEEHISTRTGRPWHGVVVNRILTGKRLGHLNPTSHSPLSPFAGHNGSTVGFASPKNNASNLVTHQTKCQSTTSRIVGMLWR